MTSTHHSFVVGDFFYGTVTEPTYALSIREMNCEIMFPDDFL